MNKRENNECVVLLNSVLDILSGAVPSSASSVAGAQLRAHVGALRATAPEQFRNQTAAGALNQCMIDAVAVGISLGQMLGVLSSVNALVAVSTAGILFQQLSVVLVLTQASSIISSMTFQSVEDVDAVLYQMGLVFDPAIETAADANASDVYQALISLQASVVQFLIETEQPLPRLVHYNSGRSFPSLTLSVKLYADPSVADILADQLVGENKVVNPAFMPATGVALSS
jgi:hypothetical protein